MHLLALLCTSAAAVAARNSASPSGRMPPPGRTWILPRHGPAACCTSWAICSRPCGLAALGPIAAAAVDAARKMQADLEGGVVPTRCQHTLHAQLCQHLQRLPACAVSEAGQAASRAQLSAATQRAGPRRHLDGAHSGSSRKSNARWNVMAMPCRRSSLGSLAAPAQAGSLHVHAPLRGRSGRAAG